MACKRVKFNEVIEEFVLDDENENRRSDWISAAAWFKRRIDNLEIILSPLIKKKHQSKKEFQEKIDNLEIILRPFIEMNKQYKKECITRF